MIRGYNSGIILTKLKNGDKDNKNTYKFFSRDPEVMEFKLKSLLDNYDYKVSKTIDRIFTDSVDDKLFYDAITVLTFWDEIMDARKEYWDLTPNDLFFALLVNYCASHQAGIQPIRSYSGVYSAKANAQSNGHALDYRDYAIRNEGESEFEHEYLKVSFSPKDYSEPFDVQIPVKHVGFKKLGIVKICTDNIPSRLSFADDPDKCTYTIPAYLWMKMLADGVRRKNKVKFAKNEEKQVSDMINSDRQYIKEILDVNDFETAFILDRTVNHFETEWDPDTGNLIISNARVIPEIQNGDFPVSGYDWERVRQSAYKLKSNQFYIAGLLKGGVHILAPR